MQIEKEVLEACIKQDRLAQNKLYRQVFSYLMSICIRYKNDYDTAGASLNSIFLKILDNLGSFKKEESFVAWIKRIAVNHLIDEYRKQKREQTRLTYLEDMHSCTSNTVRHQKEGELESEYLLDMIRELPPLTAKVFNLFAIDGYKHREIAVLLKMSENTSKWHLREARIKLKAKLEIFNETASL